jgi:hypothetical protein
VQEVFDTTEAAGLGADRFDEGTGERVDADFGRVLSFSAGEEADRSFFVRRRVGCL